MTAYGHPLRTKLDLATGTLNLPILTGGDRIEYGGVAEWSKAAVLKTVVPSGTVGSNPTSSAFINVGQMDSYVEIESRNPEQSLGLQGKRR